ncbi:unnamed protein product, partial [Polarella glacialis]
AQEASVFELLFFTERGFQAFQQFYQRAIPGYGAPEARGPKAELGFLWPQVHFHPHGLPEYAFMDFLRDFVNCTDGEALDFFEILDSDFLGVLSFQKVYAAVCIIAALSSRQLAKYVYMHSRHLYDLLSAGGRTPLLWPKVQMLQLLLGAPLDLISRICEKKAPFAQLSRAEFDEAMFHVAAHLDRGGADPLAAEVINEMDRMGPVKSKLCTIL